MEELINDMLAQRIAEARSVIKAARSVTVLTGAGISTDSGIPDFRGPNGVWTKNPASEKKSHIDTYIGDLEYRKARWQRMAVGPEWEGREPNDGHRALLALERDEKLNTLVTQNVDGLHLDAGSSSHLTVEVHGTTRRVKCLDCGAGASMQVTLERVRNGDVDPACKACGGILKSATISFGQALDPTALMRAERAASGCEVLLAIGTSLGVYPVANMVPIAMAAGAQVIIVNAEPTGCDHLAAVVLNASISQVLPKILDGDGS